MDYLCSWAESVCGFRRNWAGSICGFQRLWEHLCLPKSKGGLGFRKSKKFNEAFLAKLTWMVTLRRDSICTQALRSKYKVWDDWLSVEPILNASPTWKAIEKLKGAIAKGAYYLVGDGAIIDVWKDPWVLWLPNFIPQPKIENDRESLVVSCLINQSTRSWTLSKLDEMFTVEFVETIKRINIPINSNPDRLIWIVDPNGKFSVLLVSKISQASNFSNNPNVLWSKLWKLHAHERLKMFLWRVGSDILPTNKNFAQRIDSGCPSYPLSHGEEESAIHLFFHCNVAKAIWFVQGMNIHSECLPLQSTADIVNLVLNPPLELIDAAHWKEISHTFAIRFILTLECIWSLCNKVVHKEPQFNISTILHGLKLRIIEHYQDQVTTCRNSASPIMRWTTPPAEHINLNTDATVRANSSSIAVVARNSVGGFCIAWAKHLSVSDPEYAEAAAILWALQLALLENYSKVMVESNSKVCIDAIIGSPSEVNWKIVAIIANVISLSLNFVSVCFVWVKR